jgi:hypothetical protein
MYYQYVTDRGMRDKVLMKNVGRSRRVRCSATLYSACTLLPTEPGSCDLRVCEGDQVWSHLSTANAGFSRWTATEPMSCGAAC